MEHALLWGHILEHAHMIAMFPARFPDSRVGGGRREAVI